MIDMDALISKTKQKESENRLATKRRRVYLDAIRNGVCPLCGGDVTREKVIGKFLGIFTYETDRTKHTRESCAATWTSINLNEF